MREKGFTLIELLITISILSILMTIAVITYENLQKNARDGKRKSDIATIQSALEQYHSDQGFYPSSIPFNSTLMNPAGTKTYLTKVPQEAKVGQPPYSYTELPSGCLNTVTDPTTYCRNYCLYATVENTFNAVAAPICTVSTGQYQVQAP